MLKERNEGKAGEGGEHRDRASHWGRVDEGLR